MSEKTKNVDYWRAYYLSFGEFIDAWRIVPRVLVIGYGYLLYKVVDWYMTLKPEMIKDCVSDKVMECIAQAPNNQHAALVTAVIGVAAAVMGLYLNSGRKWSDGVVRWNPPDRDSK